MTVELYRNIAVRIAAREVGVKESPPDSNFGPRVSTYETVTGAYHEPWCASFVQWCFKQAGMPQPFLARSAYVPYILAETRKLGWIVPHPEAGDLVCFDWEQDGEADHIGFVTSKVDRNGNFNTIEGNTSYGNNSNGGEVMRRTRHVSEVAGFIRVPGGKTVAKPKPAPKKKPVVQTPEQKLRERKGYYSWLAWYLGEGDWKAYGRRNKKVRPNVSKVISAAWWVREKLHQRRKK